MSGFLRASPRPHPPWWAGSPGPPRSRSRSWEPSRSGSGPWAAAGIIAPTMLALVLTIAVLPIGRWARRHGWPGWLATLTALAAAYLILLVMVAASSCA